MSIKFTCEWCGKRLQAKDKAAGTDVNCPECASIIQVPQYNRKATAQVVIRNVSSNKGQFDQWLNEELDDWGKQKSATAQSTKPTQAAAECSSAGAYSNEVDRQTTLPEQAGTELTLAQVESTDTGTAYCPNCELRVAADAEVCTNCLHVIKEKPRPVHQSSMPVVESESSMLNTSMTPTMWLVGFIVYLVVLYFRNPWGMW